jgi:hypothetical protein
VTGQGVSFDIRAQPASLIPFIGPDAPTPTPRETQRSAVPPLARVTNTLSRVGGFGTAERRDVARRTVLVSDISGKEIVDGEGATLTISYTDARRGVVRLDVNANEVADLARKGVKQARRGRKPKS